MNTTVHTSTRACAAALLTVLAIIMPPYTAQAGSTVNPALIDAVVTFADLDIDEIEEVEKVNIDGWTMTRYVNPAYPCSISGDQSFVIGTRDGDDASRPGPLWVRMRGGGAGWFKEGVPLPTAGGKKEEPLAEQLGFDSPGLMADAKQSDLGFRVLIVSMCSHDIYAGTETRDPGNFNLDDDGARRRTNGLTSTLAAFRFTTEQHNTDDTFLHGTSAGGVGTFHVAWALQSMGHRPDGLIADSGVLNQEWQVAAAGNDQLMGCDKTTVERGEGVLGRIDSRVADPANEPHRLVADGRLKMPIMHVWNIGDANVCGRTPMLCPLDGPDTTLPAAECNHEPLRRAIHGAGPNSRSVSLPVCVEGNDPERECDRHVVTTVVNGVNTIGGPADYNAAILDWVRLRVTDD
jgi:hypothetical protein